MRKSTSTISVLNIDMLNSDNQTAGAKLQDSENTFNSIFDKSPSGNFILSKDLTVLHANPAMLNMLGLQSVKQIAGTNILQYAHPNHHADWLMLHQQFWLQQASSFTVETRMFKKGTGLVWCKLTAIAYQESGNTLCYGIVEDISKQKNDEETIKRSQANLLTILNNAESGYVLYNSKLEIVSYNTLADVYAIFLYGKELKEGNYLLDYFPPERHDALLDVTSRVIRGEDIRYERIIQNSHGEDRWMEAKWINVKDADNKSWGFILVSTDITESKTAAMEREKITQDLMLRNKAMEQFTNIASHNLRAPVANIIGLAELIEEVPMDEDEKKEMMEGILLSAKSLDTVINDINEILQIKNLYNETKEKVFFEQLVSDIRIIISGMIQKEHVTINCDFDAAGYIYGTRSYLYSIFYNMVLNSIKYRKVDVEPVITLSSQIIAGKLQLSFKDNGKGIDLQRHGHNLFGLYKRFDTTVQGRGLGLFMVKSQVETLGGTISVKSEPGEGTEFIVEFLA